MNRALLKQYTKLVDFLSQALGPDYEITLHDLSDKSNSIIAIANGYISGRTVGAPLTNVALRAIHDKSYEQNDFRINYSGLAIDNKILRSSTMYIKDDSNKLVGLLCINFDDTRYQELSTRLFQLCHPDEFVERKISVRSDLNALINDEDESSEEETEQFPESLSAVTDNVIHKFADENGLTVDRLTQEEKLRIVDTLNQRGVFMIKGAVNHVAKELKCSSASIYRYLGKLSKVP